MTPDKLPTATISFEDTRNIHDQLSRAGIDFVTVHENRILAIYSTAIFNITAESSPLTHTSTAAIECWEPPLPDRWDTSPTEAIEALQNVLSGDPTSDNP